MNNNELVALLDRAIKSYKGDSRVLESAIGALVVGRLTGWKPLALIHTHTTFRKYEHLLGVTFSEVLPEVGPLAHKSLAWQVAQSVGRFWDVVKNRLPGRTVELE